MTDPHVTLWHRLDRGLTRLELAAEAGWSEGKAGGALADTIRVGLGRRSEQWRLGQRVFTATTPPD